MISTDTGFIDPARSTPCTRPCRLDRRPEDTPVDKVPPRPSSLVRESVIRTVQRVRRRPHHGETITITTVEQRRAWILSPSSQSRNRARFSLIPDLAVRLQAFNVQDLPYDAIAGRGTCLRLPDVWLWVEPYCLDALPGLAIEHRRPEAKGCVTDLEALATRRGNARAGRPRIPSPQPPRRSRSGRGRTSPGCRG